MLSLESMVLEELDYAVNQRITEIRTILGFTQQKFAADIKISRAYQGHIETDKRRVNERIIKMIAMTYGVSEKWLSTGEGDMFERFDDSKIRQIVSAFRKLDPKAQDYMLKQINLLLEYEQEQGKGGQRQE